MGIFDNVKVIDFTHAYSGPFCSMMLSDYGAEVIKIERRDGGDQARSWGPFKNDYSAYYASFSRGKKSITLNLKSKEAKKIVMDLVKDADIVLSNFKAGTLDKYGFGYEAVKAVKPDIIYATLSGFGTQGELASAAAYDNVVQGLSGIMELNGFPEDGPTKIGPAIGDSYSGLMVLIGILIAYYHRLKTGEGQKVDATMLGSLMTAVDSPILEYLNNGNLISRNGNRNPYYAPGDVYKTKDGYIAVSVKNDAEWKVFCEALKLDTLADDDKYITNADRMKNIEEMTVEIEKAFAALGMKQIEEVLEKNGIGAAHVMGISEALEDKHLKERNMVLDIDDPVLGAMKLVGNPIQLSESKPITNIPSPTLGQHTDEILAGLGFDENEIAELRQKEVI